MAAWSAGGRSPGSAPPRRITGAIWALKGKPGLLDDLVLEGETHDQRLTITPFPQPGRYATWEPYRQAIETTEGVLVAERRDPAASFAGQDRSARVIIAGHAFVQNVRRGHYQLAAAEPANRQLAAAFNELAVAI